MGRPSLPKLNIDLNNLMVPYVLGILAGDGYLYKKEIRRPYGIYRYWNIGMQTASKTFANALSDALRYIGIKSRVNGPYANNNVLFPNGKRYQCKPSYRVSSEFKADSNWYQQFNPKTNPDWLKNLESYLDTPEKQRLWLKGFYESEGTVEFTYKNLWRASFCNCNVALLEFVRPLLMKVGYKCAPKLRRNQTDCRMLTLNRNAAQFLGWLQPCIKDKPRTNRP